MKDEATSGWSGSGKNGAGARCHRGDKGSASAPEAVSKAEHSCGGACSGECDSGAGGGSDSDAGFRAGAGGGETADASSCPSSQHSSSHVRRESKGSLATGSLNSDELLKICVDCDEGVRQRAGHHVGHVYEW